MVDVLGEDDCWPWLGSLTIHGYGFFKAQDGIPQNAHRQAYQLINGEIKDGLIVRHTCDNPPCCNFAHLLAGTWQQNTQDMLDRNRGRWRRTATVQSSSVQKVRKMMSRIQEEQR